MNRRKFGFYAIVFVLILSMAALTGCAVKPKDTAADSNGAEIALRDVAATSEPTQPIKEEGALPFESAVSGIAVGEKTNGGTDIELIHPAIELTMRDEEYSDEFAQYTEYFAVTLDGDEAEKYPALAAALEKRSADCSKRSDELIEEALKNHFGGSLLEDYFHALRRADSRVLSFIRYEIMPERMMEDAELKGVLISENYDTATGKRLNLSDVVENISALPAWLNAALESEGSTSYRFAENADFDAPSEDFIWTLEYNGISFFLYSEINYDYCCVFLPFSDTSVKVKGEYTAAPENYLIELLGSADNCFYFDGRIETVSMYENCFDLDAFRNPSMLVHSDGKDYLIMDCEETEYKTFACALLIRGYGECVEMGRLEDGTMNFGNSDPKKIKVRTDFPLGETAESHYVGYALYALNGDGTFSGLDEFVYLELETEVVSEYTAEEIDAEGNVIGTVVLTPGQKLTIFRASDRVADAKTEDGRIVRNHSFGKEGSNVESLTALFAGNV